MQVSPREVLMKAMFGCHSMIHRLTHNLATIVDLTDQGSIPGFVECSCRGTRPELNFPFPHMLEPDQPPFDRDRKGPTE